MDEAIKPTIREFIDENFLFREDLDDLSDQDSLLDRGVIDSTGVMELVAYLEEEFGIAVADADIVPENLDSIDAIAGYVSRKQAVKASA